MADDNRVKRPAEQAFRGGPPDRRRVRGFSFQNVPRLPAATAGDSGVGGSAAAHGGVGAGGSRNPLPAPAGSGQGSGPGSPDSTASWEEYYTVDDDGRFHKMYRGKEKSRDEVARQLTINRGKCTAEVEAEGSRPANRQRRDEASRSHLLPPPVEWGTADNPCLVSSSSSGPSNSVSPLGSPDVVVVSDDEDDDYYTPADARRYHLKLREVQDLYSDATKELGIERADREQERAQLLAANDDAALASRVAHLEAAVIDIADKVKERLEAVGGLIDEIAIHGVHNGDGFPDDNPETVDQHGPRRSQRTTRLNTRYAGDEWVKMSSKNKK